MSMSGARAILSLMRTHHRVIVITGASAGVGRATARAFAREGARIGLIARGRDGLDGARRDVKELGGEALVLPVDVADADAVKQAAAQVEHQFGAIDVWVNNAMTSVFASIKETPAEEFRRPPGHLLDARRKVDKPPLPWGRDLRAPQASGNRGEDMP